jgi:hypothetical protein
VRRYAGREAAVGLWPGVPPSLPARSGIRSPSFLVSLTDCSDDEALRIRDAVIAGTDRAAQLSAVLVRLAPGQQRLRPAGGILASAAVMGGVP